MLDMKLVFSCRLLINFGLHVLMNFHYIFGSLLVTLSFVVVVIIIFFVLIECALKRNTFPRKKGKPLLSSGSFAYNAIVEFGLISSCENWFNGCCIALLTCHVRNSSVYT